MESLSITRNAVCLPRMARWDQTINPAGSTGDAQEGLQCLIHTNSTGPPSGNPSQDTLATALANNGLMQIQPGTYTQGRYGFRGKLLISTSDSIITVPLFDPSVVAAGNSAGDRSWVSCNCS